MRVQILQLQSGFKLRKCVFFSCIQAEDVFCSSQTMLLLGLTKPRVLCSCVSSHEWPTRCFLFAERRLSVYRTGVIFVMVSLISWLLHLISRILGVHLWWCRVGNSESNNNFSRGLFENRIRGPDVDSALFYEKLYRNNFTPRDPHPIKNSRRIRDI